MASATTASSAPGATAPAVVQGDPLIPRMLLGRQLRDLRETAGITRERAGSALHASESKITRIELGRCGLRQDDLTALLTLFGLRDEAGRATLLALAGQANARPWWHEHRDVVPNDLRPYLSAEDAARLVRCFADRHVPDLLRTGDYAREIIGSGPKTGRHLELLARRQRILRRRPRPVNLWVVLDEAVLWNPIGDAATMREQLSHMIDLCWRPNVTVQIAPYNIYRRVAAEALTLLRFPQQELPDLVYLQRDGTCSGRRSTIEHHWHVFNTLVIEAHPPEQTPGLIERVLAEY